MTNQEIFDRVVTHLFAQGCPSSYVRGNGHLTCRYRLKWGEQTLSCAIGCLISPEFYSPDLEGKEVSSPPVNAAICYSLGLCVPVGGPEPSNLGMLLTQLQEAHDTNARYLDNYQWWGQKGSRLYRQLQTICFFHGLDDTSLNKVYHVYQFLCGLRDTTTSRPPLAPQTPQ